MKGFRKFCNQTLILKLHHLSLLPPTPNLPHHSHRTSICQNGRSHLLREQDFRNTITLHLVPTKDVAFASTLPVCFILTFPYYYSVKLRYTWSTTFPEPCYGTGTQPNDISLTFFVLTHLLLRNCHVLSVVTITICSSQTLKIVK